MSGGDTDVGSPVAWLVRELRAHMRKRPKRFQLSDAAVHAHAIYETNAARLDASHLACAAGCGSCCAAHVGVEIAEAFAILRHVRETASPHGAEVQLAKVADVAAKVASLTPASRWPAQVFCAFLDGATQSCTIYPVRPLACRGYTSTDLDACRASTATLDHDHPIPADAERQVRALQVRQALAEATARLAELDAPVEHLELHVALTQAAELGDDLAWVRSLKAGARPR